MEEKEYKKQVWKPSVLTSPVPPVLVTCANGDAVNAFTVAWTGTLNTQPPITYISVRPERYSYGLIKASGEFVINLTTEELARATDYCGVRSGSKEDKIKAMGLTLMPASKVSSPIIAQSPVNIECKVRQIIPLGSHDMFMADIVALDISEELIDKNGRLALEKAGLLAYAHGDYFSLGKRLGGFGFSVRKKKKKQRNGSK
ncbi:MAG: flavin reductase family protein [Firmicutes bacterium]|nr:flavin reductase family protein [Bacillota bacterium]